MAKDPGASVMLNILKSLEKAVDTPSFSSILNDCIMNNHELLGIVYRHPREKSHRDEEEDWTKQREQLEGFTSGVVNHILEVTPPPSPHCHPEPLLTSILESWTPTIEEQPINPSVDKGDEFPDYGDYKYVVQSRIEKVSQVNING